MPIIQQNYFQIIFMIVDFDIIHTKFYNNLRAIAIIPIVFLINKD